MTARETEKKLVKTKYVRLDIAAGTAQTKLDLFYSNYLWLQMIVSQVCRVYGVIIKMYDKIERHLVILQVLKKLTKAGSCAKYIWK